MFKAQAEGKNKAINKHPHEYARSVNMHTNVQDKPQKQAPMKLKNKHI